MTIALFVIGLTTFIIGAIGFGVSLALWVYADAKVKSDQSPILWVLLMLMTNVVGIVLYLLLGRTKKDVPAPGAYKKSIIFFGIFWAISIVLFVFGTIGFAQEFGGSMSSGTFSMQRSSLRDGEWTYTARTANGWTRRSPNLSADELAAFYVVSNSGNGVRLRLEQGDLLEVIDLSGNFRGPIDLGHFEPGRVRIRLEFDRANDVYVRISWRT